MTSQLINQFLTPLIFAVFALGFTIIWYNYRRFDSAGLFALSYLFGSLAFVLEAVPNETAGYTFLPFVGDVLYFATAATFTASIYLRYDQKPPLLLLSALSAVLIAAIAWYRFVDHQVELRVQIISYGCGALLLLALPGIRGGDLRAIDRLLYWLVALFGVQFFVSTYLILNLDGQSLTIANFSTSLFLAITNFFVSALSLSIAVVLFVKYGMDIIRVLQTQSKTDDLTRLLNRRGFEEAAEDFLWDAQSNRADLSLIVCDLDHFKSINDAFGHVTGDRALQAFAGFVSGEIRQSDLFGRVGGEEFCLLLPGADLTIAGKIADSLRRKIEGAAFHEKDVEGRFTVSLGVAQLQKGDSYQALFKRADTALYRAKRNGRNRVEVEE